MPWARHILHLYLCNILLHLPPRLLFSDYLILKMKSLLSYAQKLFTNYTVQRTRRPESHHPLTHKGVENSLSTKLSTLCVLGFPSGVNDNSDVVGCDAASPGECSAFSSKFEVHDPCKILYYSPNEALSHTRKPKSSSILLVKDYLDYSLLGCYAVCRLANVYQSTRHHNQLILNFPPPWRKLL